MKLKEEFITHESEGMQIMVAAGGAFSGLVRSNHTAAFIIDQLKAETAQEQIAERLAAAYGISAETAGQDVAKVIRKLRSIGAIDE